MGCDIHMWAEKRNSVGQWDMIGGMKDEYGDGYLTPTWEPYGDRNYVLFGILAGVRAYGPAIVPPRGVPVDVSRDGQTYIDQWGADGHSHSWLTVTELVHHDWSGVTYGADTWELARMQLLGHCEDADHTDDVRIVFFFDN